MSDGGHAAGSVIGSGGEMELRAWQAAALRTYFERPRDGFLAVVTPGGGKTRFALALVNMLQSVRRVVVVCPSLYLKHQWIAEAKLFGIPLSDMESGASIVTTYHAVDADPEFFAGLMEEMPTGVIFDEIHHASDAKSWGLSMLQAFEGAERRVAMTGTAFRSDTDAIPFVRYEDGLCQPDYVYGYGQGVRDKLVRPLEWPSFDGNIGWSKGDDERLHAFSESLSLRDQKARLNASLDPNGGFMLAMLTAANARLCESDTDGGLVIARGCKHANQIAKVLHAITGENPTVVHNEHGVKTARKRIDEFRNGKGRWLVSVQMVSEGVDIPRLRVLVYATNYSTDLFFRQAMGRIVRGTGPAICYLPQHEAFLRMAAEMRHEKTHDISDKGTKGSNGGGGGGPGEEVVPLFSDGWEAQVLRSFEPREWEMESNVVRECAKERREKKAEQDRLRYRNPEYKARKNERDRLRCQDPERKARKNELRRLSYQDPERKARKNERNRLRYQDPEYKDRMAELTRLRLASKKAEREAKEASGLETIVPEWYSRHGSSVVSCAELVDICTQTTEDGGKTLLPYTIEGKSRRSQIIRMGMLLRNTLDTPIGGYVIRKVVVARKGYHYCLNPVTTP